MDDLMTDPDEAAECSRVFRAEVEARLEAGLWPARAEKRIKDLEARVAALESRLEVDRD